MEEQNEQTDQTSAPVSTGDGSKRFPAGSQDQAERPSEAAMRKTAGDQDQAGSGDRDQADYHRGFNAGYAEGLEKADEDQDHTGDQGQAGSQDQATSQSIKEVAKMLSDVIKSENVSNNNIVEEFKQGLKIMLKESFDGREHFDTICDQHSETTEALAKLTESVGQNRANNEIIKQTVGAINGVVIETAKLVQELYNKIMV